MWSNLGMVNKDKVAKIGIAGLEIPEENGWRCNMQKNSQTTERFITNMNDHDVLCFFLGAFRGPRSMNHVCTDFFLWNPQDFPPGVHRYHYLAPKRTIPHGKGGRWRQKSDRTGCSLTKMDVLGSMECFELPSLWLYKSLAQKIHQKIESKMY